MLLATELDKDVVQSYLATLATPNQLIQLTMCCSQAQLETAARPASKAAARRVWAAADKGNKAKLDATPATSSASASASAVGEATETKATELRRAGPMNLSTLATSARISTLLRLRRSRSPATPQSRGGSGRTREAHAGET